MQGAGSNDDGTTRQGQVGRSMLAVPTLLPGLLFFGCRARAADQRSEEHAYQQVGRRKSSLQGVNKEAIPPQSLRPRFTWSAAGAEGTREPQTATPTPLPGPSELCLGFPCCRGVGLILSRSQYYGRCAVYNTICAAQLWGIMSLRCLTLALHSQAAAHIARRAVRRRPRSCTPCHGPSAAATAARARHHRW